MSTVNNALIDNVVQGFARLYDGQKPEFVSRASSRVELIGGHTDYNDGFVIAAAIDRIYLVATAKRSDNKICLYSEWAHDSHEFELTAELAPSAKCNWANYGRGIAALLLRAGLKVTGANLYIAGNVPVGAGLSSSAALEISIARAMLYAGAAEQEIQPISLAKICQSAENVYANSPCGIMDQIVCITGQKDHVVFLDCRDLQIESLPLDSSRCNIMIFNSMVQHRLAGGQYGQRRRQCEDALTAVREKYPNVKSLRDINEQILASVEGQLDSVLLKRAKHIVHENARVLAAAEALKQTNIVRFAELMYQSHCSARDYYEISCEEIDFLVEQICQCDGAYGARLTGGGFGGSAVAVVAPNQSRPISQKVAKAYKQRFGIDPEIYTTRASQGVEIIEL